MHKTNGNNTTTNKMNTLHSNIKYIIVKNILNVLNSTFNVWFSMKPYEKSSAVVI